MVDPTSRGLAPCVAVVGPANSGKTTLLHLLDEQLQSHPSRPLAYVVKGNPDGTGRYLLHVPHVRETLKPRVKGAWCETTVATVGRWIDSARACLEIVLLDFGGRHAPANDEMLRRCSHYLVVSRSTETAEESRRLGELSWIDVGERCGLRRLARFRSLWQRGRPHLSRSAAGRLEVTFRADCTPGDPVNHEVVAHTVAELLALRIRRTAPAYFDLHLDRDWLPADVRDLAGLGPGLDASARTADPVTLGGRAPVWTYAAALHRVIARRPAARIVIFDPKVPGALVEIPTAPEISAGGALAAGLEARWARSERHGAIVLDLLPTTEDRLLALPQRALLARLPLQGGPPPEGPIVLSGSVPIWLHLAYSRWLGDLRPWRPIGAWDARSQAPVWVRPARRDRCHEL